MTKFEEQTFEFFDDIDSGNFFSHKEFIRCYFEGCTFSSTMDVNLRSTVQNIKLIDCKITGGYIGPGIVRNTLIDGLKVGNHLQTHGTVFEAVTIKGIIDKILITPYVDTLKKFPDVQQTFDQANDKFYKNVPWALDISEAAFKDCDIRGIPAELVKRDKETQFILKREKALKIDWEEIDLSKTHWKVAIEIFLRDQFEDCVLVAPKKNRKFKDLLEGLKKLKDAGILNS
ncbi:MAG TPA: hypothetical protein VF248_07945 [Nitrososphaeraceae archaeon]